MTRLSMMQLHEDAGPLAAYVREETVCWARLDLDDAVRELLAEIADRLRQLEGRQQRRLSS